MSTRRIGLALVLAFSCGCGGEGGSDGGVDAGPPPCATGALPALTATSITDEPLSAPVFVTQAPGRPDALWVVEQTGRIRLVIDRAVTTFLDVGDRIRYGGEQGLLGLAFHPDYESNGRFFIAYSPGDRSQNVVAEYRRSADPNVADPAEVARLVEVDDPESNHNGGALAFGPDGFLYAAIGDGGGGGDRHGTIGNGLDTQTLLGKLLRLDVDAAAAGYAAAGNPFSGAEGLPQIWAYGLRNPWRFSFDRLTGDLYLGDVGQSAHEEIDFRARSAPGGANFGWRAYEGFEIFDDATVDLVTDHAEPVFVVTRGGDAFLSGACSITGGYVYRGSAIPGLRGTYLFGDYCSPQVGALRVCDGEARDAQTISDLEGLAPGLVSFGQDLAGELYLVYINNPSVMKLEPG